MLNRLALATAALAAAVALLAVLLMPQGADAGGPPPNDDKANASLVIALPFTDQVDTSGATTEPDEPKNCNFTATVWYKLTAPFTGRVTINTYGSNFDTGVAAYTQANDLIICNDDYSGIRSQIAFDVEIGQVYWVQAGGFSGDTGNLTLKIANVNDYGQVQGTVTSQGDDMPLPLICVTVYETNHQRHGRAMTTDNGTYTVEGLEAGEFVVSFADCNDKVYSGLYYGDALTFDEATRITVTLGQTRGDTDVSMPLGGTISGTVTDVDSGLPVPDICVYANTADYEFNLYATTASDGGYTLTPAGNSFAIEFAECNSSNAAYIHQYYLGVLDMGDATYVTANPGQDVTGIDAEMQLGGSISGSVTNSITGKPLAQPCLESFIVMGGGEQYYSSLGVQTDGTYSLGGLATGEYKLAVYSCGGPQFTQVWYNGKSDSTSANKVSVTAGQTVTGIDFSIMLDPIAGDGDCNGSVEVADLLLGLWHLDGVDEGPNCAATQLNVDCTGQVTAQDLLYLLDYLANLDYPAPQGCPEIGSVLT